MTTLREAAQQALEVLESGLLVSHHAQVLIDLRAALAQQAEPEEPITRLFGTLPVHDAQQAEPEEPVAWMYTGIKQDGTEHGPHLVWKPKYMDAMSASKGAKATPLYTAPPQRKLVPLTEEDEIMDAAVGEPIKIIHLR